jgi:hypothetical protein
VGDAEIAQVVIAAEIARQDVLDGRALAGIGIEAQRAAADQALADPISLFTMEGAISSSDLIQQSDDGHGGDIASRDERRHGRSVLRTSERHLPNCTP